MEPAIELQSFNKSDIEKIDVAKAKEAIKQLKQIGLDAKRELRIWQDILSGALTSFKLTTALILVFGFYILYIIFNNDRPEEINEREEDAITCSCRSTDSDRYTALLYTFSILWVVILLLKITWDCFQFYNSKVKPANGEEVGHKRELEAIAKEEDEWHETLGHYEKSLIMQYLKVYSVGANQNSKKSKLPHPKDIFEFEQIDEDGGDDEPDTSHTHNSLRTEVEDITTTRMLEYQRGDGYFQCGLYVGLNLIFYCILMLQTIAQMGLVPLMLLLFLDSYAWICITGDKYCRDERSEYELSLDQTAVAFGFYGCILLSSLASTMLKWFTGTT